MMVSNGSCVDSADVAVRLRTVVINLFRRRTWSLVCLH